MAGDSRSTRLSRGRLAALIALVCVSLALRLWAGLHNPIDLHELKLAMGVHQLLSEHTLSLTGVRVHESPLSGGPLIFIYLALASALCPTFYGSMLATLIISALAVLGVYAAARRFLGAQGGLWAAAIYALGPLYFLTSHELDNNRVAVPFLILAAWTQSALLARSNARSLRLGHLALWALSWLILLQINFTPILVLPAFALPVLLAWPRRRWPILVGVLIAAGLAMAGLLYAFSFTTGVEVPRRLGQLAVVQIGRTGVADALAALWATNRLMGNQLLPSLLLALALALSAIPRLWRAQGGRGLALFDLWIGLWLLCGHLGVVAFEPRLMVHYLAVTYPAQALLVVRLFQVARPRLASLLMGSGAPRVRAQRTASAGLAAVLGVHCFALLLGFHLLGHLDFLQRTQRDDPQLADALELVDVRTLQGLADELGRAGAVTGIDGSCVHGAQLDLLHLYLPQLSPWMPPVADACRKPLTVLGPSLRQAAQDHVLARVRGFTLIERDTVFDLGAAGLELAQVRSAPELELVNRLIVPLPRLHTPLTLHTPQRNFHRINLPLDPDAAPFSRVGVVLCFDSNASPRVSLRVGDARAALTGLDRRTTLVDDRRTIDVWWFDVGRAWKDQPRNALLEVHFRPKDEQSTESIDYLIDLVEVP
ncbi:MAG: glycosyltransferase family 39 protein [Candidatus Alcyoniella australis]|nr:glycosyltransferase family 39 protein [Candidatus Alcyoniella australis]